MTYNKNVLIQKQHEVKTSKKEKSYRAYTWSIVTYATSEEEFQELLKHASQWAYCKHDKDWNITDEGEVIQRDTHFHILLAFEEKKSNIQIKSWIKSNQNTFTQTIEKKDENGKDRVKGCWDYLIHANEDPSKKHIYSKEERKCSNLNYWEKRIGNEISEFEKNKTFIEDLISEQFDEIQMAYKYGKDYIRYRKQYLSFRKDIIYHNTQILTESEQKNET